MERTTNLGLAVYDRDADDAVLFEEWRTMLAGNVDKSNMKIIDRLLGLLPTQFAALGLSVVDGMLCITYEE